MNWGSDWRGRKSFRGAWCYRDTDLSRDTNSPKHEGGSVFVDAAVIEGFERSHISILASRSGQAWWANAKEIFNSGFVSYVEGLLQKGNVKNLHPAFLIEHENSPK